MKTTGERIKRIRLKKGIISRWENGFSLPNKERPKAISELGNTTVYQLLNSNPLSDYSTDELLQEIERRVVSHEATDK